jgi:hypothetical protein
MQLWLRRLLIFNMKGIVSRDWHSLTTQRRDNRKIRHENEILKANERLHIHANTSYTTIYQFVFDILACFAVGVGAGAKYKFFPEPNSCKNHAAAQCWDSDPVRSEFLAGSTSGNFYRIYIRPHSECLKGECHEIFCPRFFQRSDLQPDLDFPEVGSIRICSKWTGSEKIVAPQC